MSGKTRRRDSSAAKPKAQPKYDPLAYRDGLLLLIPGYDPIATAQDAWFEPDIADRMLDFFPTFLRHIEGRLARKPFILEPWQRAIIANLFGWQRLDDRGDQVRRYRELFLYVPRKNGKALALDTPIPTPKGWRTMGDLQPGDEVFDERGQPCRVLASTDVLHGHVCYAVEFSDGERIVADAGHLWRTHTRKPEYGTRVWTTEQIAATLTVGTRQTHCERNHSIPVAGALQLPEQELPLPPYLLGVWLGDGNIDDSRITLHRDDAEILTYLGEECVLGPMRHEKQHPSIVRVSLGLLTTNPWHCRRGHDQRTWSNAPQTHCRRCEQLTEAARRRGEPLPPYTVDYVRLRLRELGLHQGKYLPPVYLRSSFAQRLALLQGLMDTDGTISKAGQCEFSTTIPALRDGVMELLRTLGLKASLLTTRARCQGKDCGESYRIQFWAFADLPVFRLQRKVRRQKRAPATRTRAYTRQIVAVTPVPSVPVKCIEVDSPSHLYLAGRSMIPTHNSPLVAGLGLAVLFCDDEIGQQNYIGAGDREQAGKLFRYAKGMIDQAPALSRQCRIYGGNATAGQSRSVVIEDESSFLRIISSDADTAHGDTTHLAIIDELHVQPNRNFFDTVSTSFASENRKQPLFIQLTTADYDRPSVCNDQYKIACAVRDGRLNKPEFLPVIYEAPRKLREDGEEDLDYTDPEVYGNELIWAMANPNLDVSVSRQHLRNQVKNIQETPSSLYEFLRLHLNVRTKNVSAWLNMQKWDASAGHVDLDEFLGQSCYGGLDLGATSDLTSLCLIFPEAIDEEQTIYHAAWWNWVPEETAKARARRGDTAYMEAIARGELFTTEGDEIDYVAIRQQINELGDAYGILEIAVDRLFQGVEFCQHLAADGFNVVPFGQGFLSMAAPTKEFERLINRGEFHHGGLGLIRWAAGNCVVRRDPAGNLKPDKEKSADKIDPIVAAIMALGRAMERQEPATSIYETRGLLRV